MASKVKKLQEEIEELRNLSNSAPPEDAFDAPADELDALTPDFEESDETKTTTDNQEARVEPTTSVPSDPRESDPSYWKHRFDVIQGKYNKEVTDLRDQVAELNARLDQTVSSRELPQSVASVDDAIDELASEYGEEFTKAIDKRVSRIVKSQLKDVEQELAGVRQHTVRNVQEKFEDRLSQSVPNWRDLNINQDFIGWLGNTEPYSGATLQQLLLNAYSTKDVDRVAKIFNTYNQLTKANDTPVTPSQQTNSPDMLVEPTKRGSVSHNTAEANSGRVYTEKQVEQFYTDMRNGKFRGRDEWVEKTRQDIMLAARQNRIVG